MNKLSKKALKKARSEFDFTLQELKKQYPNSETALNWGNPFQLLIATILSAQCTDIRVNMVTPKLFAKYKSIEQMADAKQESLEKIIKSTGFYRNKAKNIIACSKILLTEFEGKVPDEIENLIKLPGVARKTANVVLWNAFGKNQGVVVDTHVKRTSYRLGWTDNTSPEKVEKDLMKLVPKDQWGPISHLLIDLGREFCKAPNPKCEGCFLRKNCPWFRDIISK